MKKEESPELRTGRGQTGLPSNLGSFQTADSNGPTSFVCFSTFPVRGPFVSGRGHRWNSPDHGTRRYILGCTWGSVAKPTAEARARHFPRGRKTEGLSGSAQSLHAPLLLPCSPHLRIPIRHFQSSDCTFPQAGAQLFYSTHTVSVGIHSLGFGGGRGASSPNALGPRQVR